MSCILASLAPGRKHPVSLCLMKECCQLLFRLEDRNYFKLSIVVGCGMHTCNPRAVKAEAGKLGLYSKSLDYRIRIFPKTNKQNRPT